MEPNLNSTLALLAATPATLNALLLPLPESLTHTAEGEHTWTIAQVLAHLIHGERTDWLPRIQIILRAGDSETFPAFERDAHLADSRPIPDLLADFAEQRAASLAHLQALQADTEGPRTPRPPPCLRRSHPRSTPRHLAHPRPDSSPSDLPHPGPPLPHRRRPLGRYLGVLHCQAHSEDA